MIHHYHSRKSTGGEESNSSSWDSDNEWGGSDTGSDPDTSMTGLGTDSTYYTAPTGGTNTMEQLAGGPVDQGPHALSPFQVGPQLYGHPGGGVGFPAALAKPALKASEPLPIRAYHASPYKFDKFRWDPGVAGTGEGFQTYGHGLYFTENPEVADAYRTQFAARGYKDQMREAALRGLDPAEAAAKPGATYEVNLRANPEQFLDLDRMMGQQDPSLLRNLGQAGFEVEDPRFMASPSDIYAPKDFKTADIYNKAGIKGTRYLDQFSRDPVGYKSDIASLEKNIAKYQFQLDRYNRAGGYGDVVHTFTNAIKDTMAQIEKLRAAEARGPTRNYAVWDPDIIDILRRYRRGGAMHRRMADGGEATSDENDDWDGGFQGSDSGGQMDESVGGHQEDGPDLSQNQDTYWTSRALGGVQPVGMSEGLRGATMDGLNGFYSNDKIAKRDYQGIPLGTGKYTFNAQGETLDPKKSGTKEDSQEYFFSPRPLGWSDKPDYYTMGQIKEFNNPVNILGIPMPSEFDPEYFLQQYYKNFSRSHPMMHRGGHPLRKAWGGESSNTDNDTDDSSSNPWSGSSSGASVGDGSSQSMDSLVAPPPSSSGGQPDLGEADPNNPGAGSFFNLPGAVPAQTGPRDWAEDRILNSVDQNVGRWMDRNFEKVDSFYGPGNEMAVVPGVGKAGLKADPSDVNHSALEYLTWTGMEPGYHMNAYKDLPDRYYDKDNYYRHENFNPNGTNPGIERMWNTIDRSFPLTLATGGAALSGPAPAKSSGGPIMGLVKSAVAGRTDRLPVQVLEDSYVVPADVVSNGFGQGNTDAGGLMLDKILDPHHKRGQEKAPNLMKGETIPVIVAGGEYVVPPWTVLSFGGGNMKRGHEVLDEMVKKRRVEAAKEQLRLPGPKVN
jgi:hypothetical protein